MQIIADRRALHRIPELGRDLPETRAYLRAALAPLGCAVFAPTEHDLCAFFDFGAESALAFRADMDALPIPEQKASPYRSCHEGQMHACGHDGHMAILLELARRLSGKSGLKHNILLIFQSAEETVGGAEGICQSGVLETYCVKAVFGLHLWPGLEKGKLFTRPGGMMARSAEVTLTVRGKSCHIARPAEGVDALAAAVAFYQCARTLEKYYFAGGGGVLNFGKLTGGTVRNALADTVVLEGTLRCPKEALFQAIRRQLEYELQLIDRDMGTRSTLHFSSGYPSVTNDPVLTEQVQRLVPVEPLEAPSMTTEDFSFYQQRVPGVFFFLGLGDTPALHAADFDFDDTILTKGADFFEKLAEEFQ